MQWVWPADKKPSATLAIALDVGCPKRKRIGCRMVRRNREDTFGGSRRGFNLSHEICRGSIGRHYRREAPPVLLGKWRAKVRFDVR